MRFLNPCGIRLGLSAKIALTTSATGATAGGRGTTGSSDVVHGARLPIEMLLVSSVTAPFCARAAPQAMLAPVFNVMLVSARMSPTNEVVVPSVAELPTCQKTLVGLGAAGEGRPWRAACGDGGGGGLEDEDRVGIALRVQCEGSGQLRGVIEGVNARREHQAAQVLTGQVCGGRPARQHIVSGREIHLSLARESIGCMERSRRDQDARGKPDDRIAGADADVAVDHARTGVGDRGACQHPEACRGPQIGACAWLGDVTATSPATEVDAATKARQATPAWSRRANAEYSDFISLSPDQTHAEAKSVDGELILFLLPGCSVKSASVIFLPAFDLHPNHLMAL